jgi:hypothetical protein
MSETILQEAERIINGERRADYGPVEDSFLDIAARWTQELKDKLTEDITPFDVVHLMVQLKLSRAKNGYHRDSYVDIGGYVGLTEKLSNIEQPTLPWVIYREDDDTIHEIPVDLDVPFEDAFFIEHMTAPIQPRVWEFIDVVPEGVVVEDKDGAPWKWDGDVLMWDDSTGFFPWGDLFPWGDPAVDPYYDPDQFGPFTEVVE